MKVLTQLSVSILQFLGMLSVAVDAAEDIAEATREFAEIIKREATNANYIHATECIDKQQVLIKNTPGVTDTQVLSAMAKLRARA
jgi:hypothetical protein